MQTIEDVHDLKVNDLDNNLSYVIQTALSVDDTGKIITVMKLKFQNITGPD